MGPARWASALILQMATAARRVSMAARRGVIMDGGRAEKISTILRNYLGPGGADSVYEEVDCFSKLQRTRLTMDVFPVEFGSLRREAAFPEACVLAQHMRDAALSQSGKSRVSASAPGELGSPAAPREMRRLLVSHGSAVRRDVLVAADVAASSHEDADFEARAAYRGAKMKGGDKKKEEGDQGKKNKAKGEGRRTMVPTGARGSGSDVINATANAIRRRHARCASAPNPPSLRKVLRPRCPFLSAESTISAQDDRS